MRITKNGIPASYGNMLEADEQLVNSLQITETLATWSINCYLITINNDIATDEGLVLVNEADSTLLETVRGCLDDDDEIVVCPGQPLHDGEQWQTFTAYKRVD